MRLSRCAFCLAAILCGVVRAPALQAGRIVLKDGRELSGRIALLDSLAQTPRAPRTDGAPNPKLIVLVDDNLRRYFVPKRQIAEVHEADAGEVVEKFTVWQRTASSGMAVQNVGSVLNIGPFDEFGRRVFQMNIAKGPVDVVQGITEITPKWTKVEGITHVWDLRVATSSIPNETLAKILSKAVDPSSAEQRLKVARFYLQSERYQDARQELEDLLQRFPELADQIAPQVEALRQLGARRMLEEIELRRTVGQHRLAASLLSRFPTEDVSGITLQAVREALDQVQQTENRARKLRERYDADLAQIDLPDVKDRLTHVREELVAECNANTLDRLAAYERLSDDTTLLPAEKLALAASGWLLGSALATDELSVALSLYEIRDLVRAFLIESVKLERDRLLEEIRRHEGATPELVAQLVLQMKPPLSLPTAAEDTPGFYELEVQGLPDEPPTTYLVQLPPEYDPLRRYPAVVTLHAARTTPELQVDWWAGGRAEDGTRRGQATRHGYIVIAPAWAPTEQRQYDYSARAHAAVLHTLRDACRRFAIDTDRVFLSGHGMGGDAAWDMALAHPDLWAGVIPIVAVSDRYCSLYWRNASYLPFYVITGELDGDKSVRNARDLDRYLTRGFNVTVAEFLGRGQEHFSDEIQQLFDWMGRFRRDFFPKQFACDTMRPWDNFFWWVEIADFPEKVLFDPADWPPPRGTRPLHLEASIDPSGGVHVRTGADRVSIFLSPELFDFGQRVSLIVNGNRINRADPFVTPDLAVLLDDIRTRGDRQHPFWARWDLTGGRPASP